MFRVFQRNTTSLISYYKHEAPLPSSCTLRKEEGFYFILCVKMRSYKEEIWLFLFLEIKRFLETTWRFELINNCQDKKTLLILILINMWLTQSIHLERLFPMLKDGTERRMEWLRCWCNWRFIPYWLFYPIIILYVIITPGKNILDYL